MRQIHKTFDSMAHSFVFWTQELIARDPLAPGAACSGFTNPLAGRCSTTGALVAASKGALEA